MTIDIGANDLFLLQKSCNGAALCILAGLPGLLPTISANLDTIFGGIRTTALYDHQLVALTDYSLNYSDPVGTAVISQINQPPDATTALPA